MSIDFNKCEVCTPTGERLQRMNEILWKLFPYDRPVYNELMEGRRFYTLTNYALYRDDEFIGNAGLFPVSIWLDGKIRQMIGIAAVVTVPQYRKQGVAKYLMNYCMDIIDREKKASILFTELPDVYEGHGFATIEQQYLSASAKQIRFDDQGLTRKYLEQLSDKDIEMIRWIYDDLCPNYDGKVLRTKNPDYYDLYEMFFNLYPKPRLVFCKRGNDVVGYMRFDVEHDRITITELCAAPEADDTLKSLLGFQEISQGLPVLKVSHLHFL